MKQKSDTNKLKTENLGLNTTLYLAAQIVAKLASLILLPIYTYYIEPGDLGVYEYIRSYIAVTTVLSGLGLSTFYLRFYAQEKDKLVFNGSVFWFLNIWNIVLLGIEMLILPFILKILDAPCAFFPYVFMAMLYQLFFSVETIPMRTYRIKGEVVKYFLICFIKAVLQVLFMILFLKYFRGGIKGRYMAEILITFLFAIVFIVYMIKNSVNRIDWSIIKKGLKFSLPIVPSDLLQIVSTTACTIMIEKFLKVEQLGIYSIGLSVSTIINTVTTSLWYAIEPELYIRSGSKDITFFFIKMKKIYMAVTALICVGCGIFIKEAVMLFLSPQYHSSWMIVQVLAFSYIIGGLFSMYNQIVIIQNKTTKLVLINLAKVFASVGICFALVPVFQTDALGWSYFAGYFAAFLLALFIIDREKEREKTLVGDFLVIFFSAFFIFLSRFLEIKQIWYAVLIKLPIYLFYIFLVLKIYQLKINDILDMLKKKR